MANTTNTHTASLGSVCTTDLTDVTISTVLTLQGPVTIIGTSRGEDIAIWKNLHFAISETNTDDLPGPVQDALEAVIDAAG